MCPPVTHKRLCMHLSGSTCKPRQVWAEQLESMAWINFATSCMQVPFSTFVQNVRSNEVLAVAVEDRRFAYKLRPKGKIMRGLPAGPNDVVRWSQDACSSDQAKYRACM